MTEEEWLSSTDPEGMYAVVSQGPFRAEWPDAQRTARKRALFGAACCRLVWPLIVVDERCRKSVELLERQFDEPISVEQTEEITWGAKMAAEHPEDGTPELQMLAADLVYGAGHPGTDIAYLLRGLSDWGDPHERAARIADIMRDILGNPFRPVSLDHCWQTPTVLSLAQGIYTDSAFDRLPILADALEEASCDNSELLNHCRSETVHMRGCWVIDLLLGKE